MSMPANKLPTCITLALRLLPRWVKHDFAQRAEPRQERAEGEMVAAIIERLESEFELAEKPPEPYRGWGPAPPLTKTRDSD